MQKSKYTSNAKNEIAVQSLPHLLWGVAAKKIVKILFTRSSEEK